MTGIAVFRAGGRDSRLLAPLAALVVATVIGGMLRLLGLDGNSLSHPEIYVPGIPLPPGISEPPPRHDLSFTLWWHFHDEPHPMGWYLAMFGWVELFGSNEFSLRLPSAIFGTLTIPVAYFVGHRAFGIRVGLLAAFAIALHGFHIEWSQIARMYTAGTFFALTSVYLAMVLVEADQKKPGLEICYVLTLIAGIQSTELFWAIIGIQIGWLVLISAEDAGLEKNGLARGPTTSLDRLAGLQSIALMVGAASLQHSVYRARGGAVAEPDIQFMIDYFSFGFLFHADENQTVDLMLPFFFSGVLVILCMFLVGMALRTPWPMDKAGAPVPAINLRFRVLIAIPSVLLMTWLASIAHSRNGYLVVLAIIPILALIMPAFVSLARAFIRSHLNWIYGLTGHLGAKPLLLILISIVAPLILFVLSFKVSVLAPRAFLLFVPTFLILVAAGFSYFTGARQRQVLMLLPLAALFIAGLVYREKSPLIARDYKTLAERITTEKRPDDLFLVDKKNWADTPIFYYLPDVDYVSENYQNHLDAEPTKRVWLITWPANDTPFPLDARHEALAEYRRDLSLDAIRALAELFVRE